MPIFCQNNVHSLTNTVLSCIFFQIFHEKPPAVMHIFGQNNVNSVKTTLYYGPKKSIGCPFFSNFSRKNHCSHILSKKSPFSKKHTALMPIFCQKNVHSLKNNAPMSFFSNFSWKTPCCHAHIWSKKRQFCQNYTILWAKKVNRMPFFSDFSRKNLCSHAHILKKKFIL